MTRPSETSFKKEAGPHRKKLQSTPEDKQWLRFPNPFPNPRRVRQVTKCVLRYGAVIKKSSCRTPWMYAEPPIAHPNAQLEENKHVGTPTQGKLPSAMKKNFLGGARWVVGVEPPTPPIEFRRFPHNPVPRFNMKKFGPPLRSNSGWGT